jgi:hypothetical protein
MCKYAKQENEYGRRINGLMYEQERFIEQINPISVPTEERYEKKMRQIHIQR